MKKDILLKQILYRSTHRGCKETDFLLGNFFEAKLESFKEEELMVIKNLLEEDDLKIYDWILDKEIAPNHYQVLVDDIRSFHKIS